MTTKTRYRAVLDLGVLAAAGFLLAGCLGPTYGTDKTSTEQLMDDIGNIASIKPQSGPAIDYSPRPAIVRPPKGAALPLPQQNVAENNPAWIEGPEDTRARLIAEADANANNPGYRSPLATVQTGAGTGPAPLGRAADAGPSVADAMATANASAAFRENRRIQQGAYSDRRRFLSDPPLAYRAPSDSAPVGELGETEREKEQRRKADATRAGGKRSWWPF